LNERVHLTVRSNKKTDPEYALVDSVALPGYVEPNPNFWSAASILLENTRIFFSDRKLLSKRSEENLNRFQQLTYLLFELSEKEIAKTELTLEDYNKINSIPNECLDIILKQLDAGYSSNSLSITTNMAYATNIFRNADKKYTMGGIGPACTIIVPVDIDGLVYLTKGAVYSYYETPGYNKSFINQTQWMRMLNKDVNSISWSQDLYISTENGVERENLVASVAN